MEKTVNHRIKILYEKSGYSYRKYASLLGISDTHLKNIINSGVTPGGEILQKIVEASPEINPTWILLGEEPMLKASKETTLAVDQLILELNKKDEQIKWYQNAFSELLSIMGNKQQLSKLLGNSETLRVSYKKVA